MLGRSEWDAGRIVELGCQCLADVARQLGDQRHEIAGIGITGQQHGTVVVDDRSRPLTPLINWQDKRGHDPMPTVGRTYLDVARERLGERPPRGRAPPASRLFGTDAVLDERKRPSSRRRPSLFHHGPLRWDSSPLCPPVTEPSCAGSSGLFNVRAGRRDSEAIAAIGLSDWLFPEVREADQPVGPLAPAMAEKTGLLAGTPVFAPIGDHQASFLGSLRDLHRDVLVNVGTGRKWRFILRAGDSPLPLSCGRSPCGTTSYRTWAWREVGAIRSWKISSAGFRPTCSDSSTDKPAYETLNRLAASVPPGCDGLVCDPHFSGSRADPTQCGAFAGVTPQNMTPGHFARAVLEGMARSLADGLRYMAVSENRPHGRIVAAGNALRENAVLRDSVRDAFELPLCFTRHREEAAFLCRPHRRRRGPPVFLRSMTRLV